MDKFEQNIACHLVELGMNKETARKALEDYYEILASIGWDESPEEIAKNLKEIIESGISPGQWKEHLKKFDNVPLDPWEDRDMSLAEINVEVLDGPTKRKASY